MNWFDCLSYLLGTTTGAFVVAVGVWLDRDPFMIATGWIFGTLLYGGIKFGIGSKDGDAC